jgi:hypothetical protein
MNTQGQTPLYVAEMLWERHFAKHIQRTDILLEPTCGRGAFLRAIPPRIAAFGIERDADLAQAARLTSGRPVIVGDIATAAVPQAPTQILGNPPFVLGLLLQLLDRARGWFTEDGQRAGLILAAEMLSTPATVARLARHWRIEQELLPRTLFHKMRTPILFVQFIHDRHTATQRRLVGFGLYPEALAFRDLPPASKALLTDTPLPSWRALAAQGLRQLGGRGSLAEIYAAVEGPAAASGKLQGNRFWQPKLRQVLQLGPDFEQVGRGAWALAGSADREAA